MNPKFTVKERTVLIQRALKGESVTSICKNNNISRTLFYRWLKRYKEIGKETVGPKSGGRPHALDLSIKKTKPILSPSNRLKMVEAVINDRRSATEVAKSFGVSRITLYKWLNRYKAEGSENKIVTLVSKTPHIDRYWHQAPEKYERAVLDLVVNHPEFGIRRLVSNLPKIGNDPILGHHGVQNVLRRNNLSLYEMRARYARSQVTPVVGIVREALGVFGKFFSLPRHTRSKIIRFGGIAFLCAFSLLVILGTRSLFVNSFAGITVLYSAGVLFAWVALFMGSIFFLYSLKYYLTLVIVLSFSQREDSRQAVPEYISKRKALISWILGTSNGGKNGENGVSQPYALGLEPNLDSVILKREPFISVHIPFYNEENVAERSIKAATSFDYPEYEVILCDDSTDGTSKIIESYLVANSSSVKRFNHEGYTLTEGKVRPGVTLKHLHRTNRQGFKGGALRLALGIVDSRTEFVSVFDADFVPYPDTLTLFLKYFQVSAGTVDFQRKLTKANYQIAAVQGYQWHVLNKSENWITRGVRSEYSGSYVIERSGEEIYQGLKQISGSVYMIRKDVLSEVGWATSITEDFELTLKLYEKGYKVVYTPYIQAPAECVSTLQRLIRQRMRWAEGHSHNVRKMFTRLMFGHYDEVSIDSQRKWVSSPLTTSEKLEFLYLSPYYLQAFFFLVGTISWFISETVFPARLPFWTSLWGWSLVLTNLFALPLVNTVGLLMEESEERDFLGIASFVGLSYIVVPFQAYSSIKGFLEREEGPWFRTPKTGKITDVFQRGRFYRFISGILPGHGRPAVAKLEQSSDLQSSNPYLALLTANNRFNGFSIRPMKIKWLAKATISALLVISTSLLYFARGVRVVYATNISTSLKLSDVPGNQAGEAWPAWGDFLVNQSAGATGSLSVFNNACCNVNGNNYKWYSNTFPTGNDTAIIPSGTYTLNLAKRLGPASNNRLNYAIQLMLTSDDGSSENVILSNTTYWMNNTTGAPITGDNTIFAHTIGSLASNISLTSPVNRLAVRLYVFSVTHNTRTNVTWIINNASVQAQLVPPSFL